MDGISAAASVIALVEISVKVLSLTVEYSTQVKSAKDDIARFCLELEAFIKVLRSLRELAQNPEATKLVTFKSLAESIQQCKLDLEQLLKKLEPGKGRKAMSRYGVRALKWPFERKELHDLIGILERYKSTFIAALNVDQTSLILEAGVKLDLAEQDRLLSKLSYAAGANFDSKERENEPYCLSDTRVEILSQITEWIVNPSHKSTIYWLNGMAGTGKSTIARTIARTLTEQNRLAANFFFSRGRGDLSHADKLLSTIAIQLAATSRTLKRYICEAIAEHDNVSRQSMRDQWTKLIYQPISRLGGNLQKPPILAFVFDALDECERQEDIRKLLQLVAETKDLAAVQFRVLVTSRPEIPIRLGFRAMPKNLHQDLVLHDIAAPVIQHDITVFLRHEIDTIRDERSLPSDWPSKEKLELLIERSSGLFIYAATVCRFINDPRWLPVQRLDLVLQGNNDEQPPEQRLDEMYIHILEGSVFGDCNEKEKDLLSRRFQDVVGSAIVLFDSLSTTVLKLLLPVLSETIDITLEPLKSVLDVPDDENTPIRLLHPSFRDFLINRERCRTRNFWIDQEKSHHDVAEQCLHLMSKTLKRNICQLRKAGTTNHEVEFAVLNQLVPLQLQYACQNWVGHLKKGVLSNYDVTRVHVFLRNHFLHWVEVLSLTGKTPEAVISLILLESIPQFQTNPDLLAFVKDAKRFILEFRYIVEAAPLQLYSSALIFSPKASVVRRCFSNQMSQWIERLPKVDKNWTSCLQVLEGHSGVVSAVVFSPDGQLLASGSNGIVRLWDPVTGDSRGTLESDSNDYFVNTVVFSPEGRLLASVSGVSTVRIWDPVTGELQRTLEGHLDGVGTVVFSPDGQLLASGSRDSTVRLWDPVTGDSRGTLKGHSGGVNTVVFSPDGQLLASGSWDSIVRLWDPVTGDSRGTLEGHSDTVNTVVFSPDGQLLASGSRDSTVRLWGPITGELQSTLEGHSHGVETVVFSPDGQLLASASSDATARIWDPFTGDSRGIFEGHLGTVHAVVFSPNSQLLASGSGDSTVRLWDPVTGVSPGTLEVEGHSESVNVVTFSPDAQLLASASHDGTVMVWDSITADLRWTLGRHSDSDWFRALAFSPDSKFLASGSGEPTVRLWDPITGDLRGTLEGHLDSIRALAFSPDSKLLASGSDDTTVRLWDPITGDLRGTLEGHLGGVRALAFSPDSKLLACGSYDETVELWLIEKKTLLQRIEHKFRYNETLGFSRDGSELILNGRSVEISSDPLTNSNQKGASVDISSSLGINDQWITWNDCNVLWLPFDRRPTTFALKDNTIAIGSFSGRITILSFSTEHFLF